MLQVLAFYIFIWWFKKIENRKALIARAILASIFALIYWINAIVIFIDVDDEDIAKNGFTISSIILLIIAIIIAILFTIRVILDVTKLYCSSINQTEDKEIDNPHISNNEYKDALLKYANQKNDSKKTEQ